MEIFRKALLFILNVIGHVAAIVVIAYFFLPIAKWYISYRPIWGVDFFLTTTLTSQIVNNFVPPFAIWNYVWFGGWPIFIYPILHSYIAAIFARFFDLILGVQIWMMASTLLYLVGAYFLFFILSRNFLVSTILAMALGYSSGVYQTLTWAGSLPSYATQAALPWSLVFLAWYLKSRNFRLLLASSLIAGVSIWGHPLIFFVYIIPSVLILILTRFENGIQIWSKMKSLLIFFIVVTLVGIPSMYSTFSQAAKIAFQPKSSKTAISTVTNSPTETEIGIANFNKAQVKRITGDNHFAPFAFLGVSGVFFLVSIVAVRKIKPVFVSLPYVVMTAYFGFYIWLFGQGISIYHGGWYRLFWAAPLFVGALASVLWGQAQTAVLDFLKSRILKTIFVVGTSLAALVVGYFYLSHNQANSTINQIIYRSQASSAYPDVMNLQVSDNEREQLKTRLVPSWINGDETNWRLYSADQTVNLWFNSLYKMPLARGYLDPPADRGFLFLLDAALSETEGEPQLEKVFNYPATAALSNALFLIDWNAVRYFEGGHTSDAFTPFPKYLQGILTGRNEILDFNDQRYTKRSVTLNYHEISEEFTSPILSATNASTIGIFGSERGFETVVRAITERGNRNSQVLIPIKLGKLVDQYSSKTLNNFDSLYLYDYDYKNQAKAFKLLRSFLESGKKVFVDTGTEVKEANGVMPDDIFPVKSVVRRGMGKEWQIEVVDRELTRDVDFTKFPAPIFDEVEWNISYADESTVKSNARVILKNKGKVIMASQKVGQGELIWGGMNLAYHLIRFHNEDESRFFDNILASLLDLNKKPKPQFSTNFVNANKRVIKSEGARGILFKEMAYDGWRAKLLKKGAELEIYKAGPAYPGYMYIALPNNQAQEVELSFGGSINDKILFSIALILSVFIAEELLLGGLLLGRLRSFAWKHSKKNLRRWWEKED